jgi:hypothetical protein
MIQAAYASRTRLGDSIIAAVNACHLANKQLSTITLHPNPKIFQWDKAPRERSLQGLRFAASLFKNNSYFKYSEEIPPYTAKLLSKLPTCNYSTYTCIAHIPKFPIICYDFNPRTRMNRPTKKERTDIINFLNKEAPTFNCSLFANEHSLEHMFNILKSSLCYVDCDSGITHVAHTINIPCHIIRFNGTNGRMERWHKYQNYSAYNTSIDFMENFTTASF